MSDADAQPTQQPLAAWTLSFLRPYRGRVALLAVLLLLADRRSARCSRGRSKIVIDYVLGRQPVARAVQRAGCARCTGGRPVALLVVVVVAGVAAADRQPVRRRRTARRCRSTPASGWSTTCATGCSSTCRRSACITTSRRAPATPSTASTSTPTAIENLVMSGVFPLATSVIDAGRDVRRSCCRLDVDGRAAVAGGRAVPLSLPALLHRRRWSTARSASRSSSRS